MSESCPHWSTNTYWTDALDQYHSLRNEGVETINIDLNSLENMIYDGDSPAYKLVEAMISVAEHEGYEGHRGAPRLVLALLQLIHNECNSLNGTNESHT